MPKSKKSWQSKAGTLGHLRTKIAKEELAKELGDDFEVISQGYPE
jgi:hypothetical protein